LDGEWKRLDHLHRRRDCECVGATWGSLRPADQTAELLSQHKARCQAASRSEKGRKESASRNRSEPTGARDSAARQYLSGIDSVGTSSHRCRSRSGHDKRQGPRHRLSCGHCVRHYARTINKKGSPGRAQQRGATSVFSSARFDESMLEWSSVGHVAWAWARARPRRDLDGLKEGPARL
jgi:hypothetical protein